LVEKVRFLTDECQNLQPNFLNLRKYFMTLAQIHFSDLSQTSYGDIIGCLKYDIENPDKGDISIQMQGSEANPNERLPSVVVTFSDIVFEKLPQIGEMTPSDTNNPTGNMYSGVLQVRNYQTGLEIHALNAGVALALASSWLDAMFAISCTHIYRKAMQGAIRSFAPLGITNPKWNPERKAYKVGVALVAGFDYTMIAKIDAPILNRIRAGISKM
jgi:hypothetical protein